MARRRFVAYGLVQGVFFRATAAEEARRMGLTGRIWNRDDGAVECVAEGDADRLDRFGGWLARGPRLARVERLETADLEGPARYTEFLVG